MYREPSTSAWVRWAVSTMSARCSGRCDPSASISTRYSYPCASPQRKPSTYAEPRPSLPGRDRKSTRLNSSHMSISYAVFALKKKSALGSWLLPASERCPSADRLSGGVVPRWRQLHYLHRHRHPEGTGYLHTDVILSR